jgi:hypothetical protein
VKKMAREKKSKFHKNRKGAPQADVEFVGENGLEKVALINQKMHKK